MKLINLALICILSLLLVSCEKDNSITKSTCDVADISVTFGDCIENSNYALTVDFLYSNPSSSFFQLFARNNNLIDTFDINSLPITITDFPISGEDYEFIKICIAEDMDCCEEFEFLGPECDPIEQAPCELFDIILNAGECNSEETYELTIDFLAGNPTDSLFDVFIRNGLLIGTYDFSQLPLTISEFPISQLEYDFIKICVNDNEDCCIEAEILSPECDQEECEIFDLEVEFVECTTNDTYVISIDFEYENAGNASFDLFTRNNTFFGNYQLSNLPIVILDFEKSGEDYDFLKVCINDNTDCCAETEILSPECDQFQACEIRDLVASPGVCSSDSTYLLTIDFIHENASNDYFDVIVRNNENIGFHLLSDLPITIQDFPISGKDYDFLKICINDDPDCCYEIEFMPPGC